MAVENRNTGRNKNTASKGLSGKTAPLKNGLGGEKVTRGGKTTGTARTTRAQSTPAPQRRTSVPVRMNINEQTPSGRKSVKELKRIDPERPEIKRSTKKAQGYKIKKKKKKTDRIVYAYGIIFVIIFAFISLIVFGLFYATLTDTEGSRYEGLSLVVGLEHEAEEIKDVRVDSGKYVQGNVLYVNMSNIADVFGFVTTGDHEEIRYITDISSGEDVRFYPDSPEASVNGTMIRMNGKALSFDGELFVPLSFIEEYVYGIRVEFDDKEMILSLLKETERNEAGRFVEKNVEFKLKEERTSTSLPENELTDEIKEKCIFVTVLPDGATSDVVDGGIG